MIWFTRVCGIAATVACSIGFLHAVFVSGNGDAQVWSFVAFCFALSYSVEAK